MGDWWVELLVSLLLLVGAGFALVGSIGLARFPDFFMRLHGPTKATTLGVGAMVVGSAVYFSTRGDGLSLHEVLITVFLFITAPVSAHMLAKAALHLQVSTRSRPAEPPPALPTLCPASAHPPADRLDQVQEPYGARGGGDEMGKQALGAEADQADDEAADQGADDSHDQVSEQAVAAAPSHQAGHPAGQDADENVRQ